MVSSTVILQAAPSLSEQPRSYKIGFTATKKIGKAHVRNRTKRRLRAVARAVFPKDALPNTDYVLVGRFNTADCPIKKLKGDMKWALKKINKLLEEKKNLPQTSESTQNVTAGKTDPMSVRIVIAPIRFYQKFISPLCRGCCRFRPTCSQYAIEAIRTHGICKGLYLGLKRLLRCHPWGGCGDDPVPPVKNKK